MSERRLVIHAGFHKSGTTALQEAFDAQSEELKSAGILYPNMVMRFEPFLVKSKIGK